MSFETLEKQIKSGNLSQLYLLYGEESYLKGEICSKIKGKAVGGAESFNFHTYDSENFNLSEIEAAFDAVPLMSERKCILIKDVDPDELKAEVWKNWLGVLKKIPDDTVVILWFDAVVCDRKSSRWKTLVSNAEKHGQAEEIVPLSVPKITEILIRRAKSFGCGLSKENAAYLTDICGTDLNTLFHELDKLCAYSLSGEIRKESIDTAVSKPLSSTIYDFAKNVAGGRREKALQILDELFAQKVDPVIILSAISSQYCDLYRAKTARNCSRSQKDIEADFHYKGLEFRIRNSLRDSAQVSKMRLMRGLNRLMKADEAIKSARADNRMILERLVIELTEKEREEGGI